MKQYIILTAGLGLFGIPALADGHITGDAAAGEEAFKQCVACHVVVDEAGDTLAGRNARTGPNLYGVSGRAIASVDGFRYSRGLTEVAESGAMWDEAAFVGYVQDPTGWIRETTGNNRARSNMSFRVRSEDDALNLYAYLASLGGGAAPADGDAPEASEAAPVADQTQLAEAQEPEATDAAADTATDTVVAASDADAAPTTHVVEMLNADPDNPRERMVFSPSVLQINPGDTVLFKATDKSHNTASVRGMIPEGAEEWRGAISQDHEVTFDVPGIYGYNCVPHASTGMVGLIVVKGEGMLANLEDAKAVRQRGKSKQRFEAIWEAAEAAGYLAE